jgi:2-oxoglutarate dehydrogenase E2 component (dihydrolipoamide succinyltransferase)
MTSLKVPSPGESITEVVLSKWFVENGIYVENGQELGEIESDKATLPLIAQVSGIINIIVPFGTTIAVGSVVCNIDESAKKPLIAVEKEKPKKSENKDQKNIDEAKPIQNVSESNPLPNLTSEAKVVASETYNDIKITPVARKMMEEAKLSVDDIIKGLRRLGKDEVQVVLNGVQALPVNSQFNTKVSRDIKREPMSQLRKKLSKRLVAVKNETAMLTTFNEIDMSEVMALRVKYQKQFTEKHGIKLGFMSIFTKAASIALQQFPKVNSMIDGDDILSSTFADIGIAVQTEKGLMVPIIRNTEILSLAEIEKTLAGLAEKARAGRLGMDEMTGGTFTITNGGVFGSLLSTPIINPPQSAILGMHNIVERPVAVNGKVEIRPMMYVALSYDHRIIDGKDSVSFLFKIKELIESPYKLVLGSSSIEKLLLGF